MKSRCHIKKKSGYALLALVFAVLMILCSTVSVCLDGQFRFSWLQLRFDEAERTVGAVSFAVLAICSIVTLAACVAVFLGLKPRSILFLSAALLLFSLCRYWADMYLTLRVEVRDFYVISPAHIDLAFSLVIFVLSLLTVCNVIKSSIPLTLTAMSLGLFSLVLTVFGTGSFCRGGVSDLSGTVYYLSACMAIALCALCLEWERKPAAQTAEETVQMPAEAPVQMPEMPLMPKDTAMPELEAGYVWELGGTDPDGTKLYVSRRIFRDAKTGAEVPGLRTDNWYPHAPSQSLPLPAEGCVWERTGTQEDGTAVYTQRRMIYDPMTDQVIPGGLTDTCFPPKAPEQQAPSEQTLALLQQVEKLHESGILDDDEYREKCRKILEKV